MSDPTNSLPSGKAPTLDKPPKPYAAFPLTPHNSGKWMKQIHGRLDYFGNWARRVNGVLTRVEDDG